MDWHPRLVITVFVAQPVPHALAHIVFAARLPLEQQVKQSLQFLNTHPSLEKFVAPASWEAQIH